MVADAQLAVKQIQTDAVHNACQRQHATHAQLLSMSPQSDRRQKLMGDQGGGKQSTFAQLTTQVSTHTHTHTEIDKEKIGTCAKSANAGAFDAKSSTYSNCSPEYVANQM